MVCEYLVGDTGMATTASSMICKTGSSEQCFEARFEHSGQLDSPRAGHKTGFQIAPSSKVESEQKIEEWC